MSTLTDLGLCDAFTPSGRCPGRLQVTEQVGALIMGRCPECGSEAARPVHKARVDRDPGPERPPQWWDD